MRYHQLGAGNFYNTREFITKFSAKSVRIPQQIQDLILRANKLSFLWLYCAYILPTNAKRSSTAASRLLPSDSIKSAAEANPKARSCVDDCFGCIFLGVSIKNAEENKQISQLDSDLFRML